MKRIVAESIKNKKNQISTVKLVNIELDNYTVNEIFYEILSDKKNLSLMFNEDVNSTNYKRYLNYFIPDQSKNFEKDSELVEYIQEMCKKNKTFFSSISEGFIGLIIKKYLGADATHALLDLNNTQIDTHTGVDGAFFDETSKRLFFVEAKFYKEGSKGIGSVIESLSSKAKNKFDSFRNMTELYVAQILDKESYDVRTFEVVSLNLTFIGFVIHEDNPRVNEKEYAEGIENYVQEQYNISQPNYTFIMFHLKVDGKQQLIYEIITKAKEGISNGN